MQDRPLQQQSETVRIPVYGKEAFVVDSLSGIDMEQAFINCYPEIMQDPLTGEKEVHLMKRPGTTSSFSIFTASGAATRTHLHVKDMIVMTQYTDVFVVAVWNSNTNDVHIIQWRPAAQTATLIGTLSSAKNAGTVNSHGGTYAWIDSLHLTEYSQASGGIKAAVAVVWKKADETDSSAWYAIGGSSVFSTTSLVWTRGGGGIAGFPSTILTGPFQQMNGIIYIQDIFGTIYNSGGTAGTSNDITLWNTLGTITTYQAPDKGLGVFRYKHHLLAFGKNSIEFFNDAGNASPATPLERTEQAWIKFGALSSKAIINVADTLYWLAYGSNNTIGLWKLDGYTPVKISRTSQDLLITRGLHASSGVTTLDLFSLVVNGNLNIGINNVPTYTMLWRQATYGDQTNDTFKTGQDKWRGVGGTLMYNVEDNVWWSWSCHGDYTSRIQPTNVYSAQNVTPTQYTQYFFYDPNPILSTGQTKTVTTDYALRLDESDNYNLTFMVDDNPQGTDDPVHIVCQFNTFDWGNTKRKRISKVGLVFGHTPLTGTHSADTSTYSVSLVYRKGNYTSDITSNTERYISYPSSTGRYYWNNLGSARMWSFCVTALSRDSFSLKGLDLEIAQNTH